MTSPRNEPDDPGPHVAPPRTGVGGDRRSADGAQPRSRARRDPLTVLLCLACVALALVVLALVRQNRALKAQISSLATEAAQAARHDPAALQPGDRVASFEALSLPDRAGRRIEFGSGQRVTLLLVFSSSCPACEKNEPAWRRVLEAVAAEAPSLRVVGLHGDVDLGDDNLGDADLGDSGTGPPGTHPFPVFVPVEPMARVPYVPATILLDADGVVQKAWFGALTAGDEADLRALLSRMPAR